MTKLPRLDSTLTEAKIDAAIVLVDSLGKVASAGGAKNAAALETVLSKLKRSGAFTGKSGSVCFVRFGGFAKAEHLLLGGLGDPAELTEERLRVLGANLYSKLLAERIASAVVYLDSLLEAKKIPGALTVETLIRSLGEGLTLPAYEIQKFGKKDSTPEASGLKTLSFFTHDKTVKSKVDTTLPLLKATAEAIGVTRDWSNAPSNHGTPEYFAAEARKLAKTHGLKITVLNERDCAREKMNLFLGVGQGSEREGRFVVVEYKPKGVKSPKTIALVGKGITFDSGGISIKPSLKMEEMKHDMTGAATVMGAILLASKMKARNRIIAIMAFTENMPDGDAIQPGNVITGRAGKSVEIWNTDAEGRLILADALDYAQDFKPDAMIDVATLTGAVGVALGKQCCAVLGTSDKVIDRLRQLGDQLGERAWPLPLYDDYFEDLKSDCADMKNVANDPLGGTIRGAIFLKQFVRKSTPWAHLDIAYTANSMGHVAWCPRKGASGMHVRTLARFAAEF